MNSLIRARVAAVSRKRNTTRRRLVGAHTDGDRQLVFWDTPGVVERQFIQKMGVERHELTSAGWGAAADADVAVLIVDTARGSTHWKAAAKIAEQLAKVRADVSKLVRDTDSGHDSGLMLVLNKCDVVKPRTRILSAAAYFKENIPGFEDIFRDEIFMISAYNGRGVDELRRALMERTVPGEFAMPAGMVCGEDDRDLIKEHIWEKLLHRVHDEIPYRCFLENDGWKELDSGGVAVSEVIRVPKASCVPILIGPGGSTVKWVSEEAAASASETLGRPVHLRLRVAVA